MLGVKLSTILFSQIYYEHPTYFNILVHIKEYIYYLWYAARKLYTIVAK